MVALVRKFGDFFQARIVRCGYRSNDVFISESGLSRATVYKLLSTEDPRKLAVYATTLERVAESLQFTDWAEFLAAWERDEVRLGIGKKAAHTTGVPSDLPPDVIDAVMKAAREAMSSGASQAQVVNAIRESIKGKESHRGNVDRRRR